MAREEKNQLPHASDFEVDSDDLQLDAKRRLARTLDGARIALTLISLLAGIAVLGLGSDSLAVYDATHVDASLQLPLWPEEFDLRPTVALVAGATVVVVANIASLGCSRVQFLRSKYYLHSGVSLVAPLIGLVAAIVAMSLFYAVNTSTTQDTLLSWTCRWRDIPMLTRPHFGTLCRESEAGLYLSVLLVPIEAIVLGVAAYQLGVERGIDASSVHERRKSGSPSPSA